jgi:hypothetical protein
MDRVEARKILLLYRPAADRDDPQFTEALAAAERDPELGDWLRSRLEADAVIAAGLSQAAPPEGLAAKILREKPVVFPLANWRSNLLRWAAVVLVLAGLAGWWLQSRPRNSFAGYERYLERMLAHNYRMSLESGDIGRIRSYLKNNQAPADFALGAPLQKTTPLGCATLSWNGNPVSMVCFADPAKRKLFLFVVDKGAIPNPPQEGAPTIRQAGDFTTASWTERGKTYLLTVKGGPDILRNFL